MSRLSRQEIKRDEVMEGLSRLAVWIRESRRLLMWAGVVIVGGILLYLAGSAWARKRAEDANGQLTAALSAEEGVEPDRTALEDISSRYSGSAAAGIADAYLGGLAAEAGDLEDARQRWTGALGMARGSMLEASLRLNLLQLDRREGRADEVVTTLQEMAAEERPPLPADVVLFELGRTLQELGRAPEARSAFQRLVDEHPGSPYAVEARSSLGELAG